MYKTLCDDPVFFKEHSSCCAVFKEVFLYNGPLNITI